MQNGKNIAKLLLWIAGILVFIFIIGPEMEKLPLMRRHVQTVQQNNIDAGTYYYTETEQFSVAESEISHSLLYSPKREQGK